MEDFFILRRMFRSAVVRTFFLAYSFYYSQINQILKYNESMWDGQWREIKDGNFYQHQQRVECSIF